jgi:hypothetical protein
MGDAQRREQPSSFLALLRYSHPTAVRFTEDQYRVWATRTNESYLKVVIETRDTGYAGE